MRATVFASLVSLALTAADSAQTCREVARDSSGRIVQTIDRQKQSGGTVQAVTRDASGRIIGTATTRTNSSGSRTLRRGAMSIHKMSLDSLGVGKVFQTNLWHRLTAW